MGFVPTGHRPIKSQHFYQAGDKNLCKHTVLPLYNTIISTSTLCIETSILNYQVNSSFCQIVISCLTKIFPSSPSFIPEGFLTLHEYIKLVFALTLFTRTRILSWSRVDRFLVMHCLLIFPRITFYVLHHLFTGRLENTKYSLIIKQK